MSVTLADAIADARAGRKQMVTCPAHDDGKASLSVAPGTRPNDDGIIQPVVLMCHAGCETEDIMRAAGLEWSEVCDFTDTTDASGQSVWTPGGDATNVYSYVDEDGRELFQALRVVPPGGGKTFFQRQPDSTAKHGWAWNLTGVRRVLYRLPEVVDAVKEGRTVYVAEGEKDVESLRRDGQVATCNPMGAGKWRPEFAQALQGAHVRVVSDNDEPGRAHARAVRDSLVEVDCWVEILETTMPKCKDYTDHRAHGGTVDSLMVTWTSRPTTHDAGGISINDMVTMEWDTGVEIVPGFLAQANVVLLTGFEGHGKSTMMRQIAVMCASGINPFTLEEMRPLVVVYIDAENPEHQQALDWRKLARLATQHTGRQIVGERLTIYSEWMTEPDLTSQAGQAWLFERVQIHKPDLLLMGPVQNLVSRDVKDDEVVRKLKHAVNTARAMHGTAFVLEHHAPHRMQGDSERSTRPYGSSLFQKWPDFGYGLKPDRASEGVYRVHPNRKPRVRSRAWPELARWGSMAPGSLEWPWMFEPDVRYSTRDKDAEAALRSA